MVTNLRCHLAAPLAIVGILAFSVPHAIAAPILNGGFETGDLTGWTTGGGVSAQVLTALDGIVPPEGSYFALIGTGPADVEFDALPDFAVMESLLFDVGPAGGALRFSYNFLTAEFTGALADPARLDAFSIRLLPSLGAPIVLASGDVSGTAFSAVGPVVAPDGTTFFEATGFFMFEHLLGAGTYALEFRVDDAGDGSFDSGLLVDDVSVTPAAVPEPSTITLLMLGGAAGVIRRFRSRRI